MLLYLHAENMAKNQNVHLFVRNAFAEPNGYTILLTRNKNIGAIFRSFDKENLTAECSKW